jgi:hypothetical protein
MWHSRAPIAADGAYDLLQTLPHSLDGPVGSFVEAGPGLTQRIRGGPQS